MKCFLYLHPESHSFHQNSQIRGNNGKNGLVSTKEGESVETKVKGVDK